MIQYKKAGETMKSLYKFGYTIDDDPYSWIETINTIFRTSIRLDEKTKEYFRRKLISPRKKNGMIL